MINIQKQIDYWISGAEDDIVTADLLIREMRILHGLFFCHLVIEKALKAHYVKKIEYFNKTKALLQWLKMKL
jgi:HEPN domain-containing protein